MSYVSAKQRKRNLPGLMLVFALCSIVGTSLAQDRVEREGYFEVRSASSRVVDGVHTLDARLQLVLSSEALEALTSGVALRIELQMELIRERRFFFDDDAAELTVRYELEYRPLSQRYIVRNLNSGDQDSFATLYSALNNLGRIQGNNPRHPCSYYRSFGLQKRRSPPWPVRVFPAQ